MNDDGSEIGGYFEFERNKHGPDLGEYKCFQSARSAFVALLNQKKPDRLWMPKHICDSMVDAAASIGTPIEWYDLDLDFSVKKIPRLSEQDCFLYVNYFGLCDKHVEFLTSTLELHQVIIDNSQALFSRAIAGVDTIYSPRKFCGLPDGGLLRTDLVFDMPEVADTESIDRCRHLLQRSAFGAESGYNSFLEAEESLSEVEPKRMSDLTNNLLASMDFEYIGCRRNQNFRYLQEELGQYNKLIIDASSDAPLAYPFRGDDALRKELLEAKIFVPTYWREVEQRCDTVWYEEMIRSVLPLPIDQRYTPQLLERMVGLVKRWQNAKN